VSVALLGCQGQSKTTPVESEAIPKSVGLSAAMYGAAQGEHIARDRNGSSVFGMHRHKNPKRVVRFGRSASRAACGAGQVGAV
jgi:hypothetical protein